ncbi:MAG: tetratricopeptide repeat protein, partial [Phycisphaerales bacterium]|nr:tetratricopeptide repeat protein [Phycisphaerales bacterium]
LDQLLEEAPGLEVTRLDATWYAEQGDIQGATDAFSLYIVDQDEPTAEPFLALGQFLLQYNQIEDALVAFDQAREFQGEERRADKALGEALMFMGRPDEALGVFRELVDANADDENASYRKRVVEMLLQTESWDEAETYLGRIPEAHRNELTVMLQKAALARGKGDVIRSRRLLDAAVTTHDSSPFAYFRRATMLAKDLDEHPEYEPDVIADFEQALRLQPGYWQALEARGEVYRRLGQFDRCITDWRAALRINPGYEQLRARTMVYLVDRGRSGEAVEVAQEAIDVRPGDRELILGSAMLFQRAGDHARAAQFFAQAWEIDKSSDVGLAYLQSLISVQPVRTQDALAVLNQLGRETVEGDPLLLMIRAVVLTARREVDAAKRDVTLAFEAHHEQPLQREQWYSQLRTVYPEHRDRLAYIRDLETGTRDTAWATFYRARELLTQDATRADGQT